MTREEKCLLVIEKGYTYNSLTGDIYGVNGNVIKKLSNGYICLSIKDDRWVYLYGHQFAWYMVNNEVVDYIDHINGIRNDNRIENLRVVTKKQNSYNMTKSKGCYWREDRKKWRATICIDRKYIHLGYFDKEEEARQAYLDAKKIYHII